MGCPSISCQQFTDFLIRRTEHLDTEIIKDVTPIESWIGHVSTGKFPALDGVEHTFDRLNDVFPDLSGCWEDVSVASCVGQPCDPAETKIGFGSTRDSYKLQRKSFSTQLFCFDLIMSADRAKEQFAQLVKTLKNSSTLIVSDRFRTEALRGAGNVKLAGADFATATFTESANCGRLTLSALPTSKLTIQYLQRFAAPLRANGYLGESPMGVPMFELVTDNISAWNLREGNAALAAYVRLDDFVKGGNLYKYGITDAVGNFGIRIDNTPLRYQIVDAGAKIIERVYPYYNVAATSGIKRVYNDAFDAAPIQVDFIWHKMAMKSLVRDTTQINAMMPFAARDFAGKWQFAMDNLGADENGCVIENKRRNKGMFFADFSFATKWDYREWVVAIFSLRDNGCLVDVPTCDEAPAYIPQDSNSANAVCPCTPTDFDLSDVDAPYNVTQVTCNGVPIEGPSSGSKAALSDVVTWLNTNLGQLGTWSNPSETDTIRLSDCLCDCATLTVETFVS